MGWRKNPQFDDGMVLARDARCGRRKIARQSRVRGETPTAFRTWWTEERQFVFVSPNASGKAVGSTRE
jgi:hypothetical protein